MMRDVRDNTVDLDCTPGEGSSLRVCPATHPQERAIALQRFSVAHHRSSSDGRFLLHFGLIEIIVHPNTRSRSEKNFCQPYLAPW